jgi:drug/metabolite transporter (DMT)-like permease
MSYLVASIVLMSALAVILRWALWRGTDAHGLNAVYRVTGGLITLALTLPVLDWQRLPELCRLAGAAAVVAGVFYWLTGLASIKSVELGSLGVSWAVIRCSMVIPALASLLYWREVPLWPPSPALGCRLLGLAAVVGALGLLGGRRTDAAAAVAASASSVRRRAWLGWLSLAFVAQGSWEVCLRTTRSFPDNQARSFFLLVAFSLAMVLAGAGFAIRRVRLGRRELLFGLLAGGCALLASGLRVWALRDVDGIIVFPATTASVMLMVQAAGSVIWHERITGRGAVGLALAVAGIVLLTVQA